VSTRGRKRTLTDSERKRNRSAVSSKWNKCRIYVRDQLDRWNELKEVLRVQTHAEVIGTRFVDTLFKKNLIHHFCGTFSIEKLGFCLFYLRNHAKTQLIWSSVRVFVFLEMGLYRSRIEFFVMFEVV
jgi:hypothetical protein